MTAKIKDQTITEDETSFRIKVDLPDSLSESDKNAVLADIGEFVKVSMLETIGDGETPVEGGKWKKELTPKYKKIKENESGIDFANMELFGSMLDSFDYEIDSDESIKIGIFDSDQAVKAYAHNTGYKGHPTIKNGKYVRQIFPNKRQKLKSDIMEGIDEIIQEAVENNS